MLIQNGRGDQMAFLSHLQENAEIELQGANARAVKTRANVAFDEQKQRVNNVGQWMNFCEEIDIEATNRDCWPWAPLPAAWWADAAPWGGQPSMTDEEEDVVVPCRTPDECRHAMAACSGLLATNISRLFLAIDPTLDADAPGARTYIPLDDRRHPPAD
ncbi:unnamed protein product [Laminaria digitata]